jgi:recombinase, phage recT family
VLIHKPALGDRGEAIGFYAAVILKDGGKNAYWMSVDDAKKYGKRYSKTFNNGPWQTDFEAMAKKSCLRQVLKMCPCSSDVQKAIELDNKYDDVSETGLLFDMEEVEEVEANAEENQSNEQPAIETDEDGVVQNSEALQAE